MARRATNFAGSKIECPKDSLEGESEDVIRNGRTPVVILPGAPNNAGTGRVGIARHSPDLATNIFKASWWA